MAPFLIAVHAGAGYHSPDREEEYERAMKRACKAGAAALEAEGGTPLAAVAAALAALEDDPCTNAGTGSNLNYDGFVECDAAAMAGDGAFGSVAAASGIRYPGAAAVRLATDSRVPLSAGRVRPMVLAGDGARTWALREGLEAAPTSDAAREMHVTTRARRQHQKYLAIVNQGEVDREEAGEPAAKRMKRTDSGHPAADDNGGSAKDSDPEDVESLYDTVGVVVVDSHGAVAAGVSSGGIALKFPGRVGEAAVYGAGCWAVDRQENRPAVAASVTGVGERIVRHSVARACAKGVKIGPDVGDVCMDVLNWAGEDDEVPSPMPRDCGVLCAVAAAHDGTLVVHLAVAMCFARSMAVGWLVEDAAGTRRAGTDVMRVEKTCGGEGLLGLGTHWPLPDPQ